jgi:phosphatidylinositol alpha-1,6-mannosyltransferase
MKIMVLTDDFPAESRGGAGKIAASLALAYRQAGHEVQVVTTTRIKAHVRTEQPDGITVYRIYSDYPEQWRAYLSLFNPFVLNYLREIVYRMPPDVVHVHNIHYHLSYQSLRFFGQDIPIVITFHDAMTVDYGKFVQGIPLHDLSDCPRVDYRVRAWKTLMAYRFRYFPLRNLLIRWYLHRCTWARVAVSEELRRFLEVNGIRCTHVIHNGVDPQAWEVNPDRVKALQQRLGLKGHKVVLFGGRLGFWKGSEQLVKALPLIVREVPEAKLLVLGAIDGYARSLQDLAGALGVGERVVFAGWLSGEDLAAAYRASDVVAVPSIYLDPFPTIILEGMAARKPVVASCFGGGKEAVVDGETGYVVNPLNIEALARRIAELLRDTSKAQRMGEAGYRRLLDYFTIRRCAQEYLNLFARLLEKRR